MFSKILTCLVSLLAITTCSDDTAEIPLPRMNILNKVIQEAAISVDRAVHQSQEYFEENCPRLPSDFHTLFLYPPPKAVEMTRSQDILEAVIDMVYNPDAGAKMVLGGLHTLTEEELKYLIEKTGCRAFKHKAPICDESMSFNARYRSPDGTCNNLRDPNRGSALQPLARLLDPAYENGLHIPIGWTPGKVHNGHYIPLARTVTSQVITSHEFTEHRTITGMTVIWGQFQAHDMSLSLSDPSQVSFADGQSCSKVCENVPPCFPIQLPVDDARRPEESCLAFTRSGAVCGTGHASLDDVGKIARQQLNGVNSYIDASHVYGNTDELGEEMRDYDSKMGLMVVGKSETNGRPLLGLDNRAPLKCFLDDTQTTMGPCFKTGDIRANELPPLTSLHILFVREHNRVATALTSINPHWDDETLYEEAKKIVGAMCQHITYFGFLPSILGPGTIEKMGAYEGYDPEVDPSTANVFATSAFRSCHAFIAPLIARLGPDYEPIAEGNLLLHQGFFQPWRIIEEGGIDPILRGLFAVGAKDLNSRELVTSELTEHLFETSDRKTLDLESIDIQRGRDHGLPSYTKWREFCGLGTATKFRHFRKLISNKKVLRKFRRLYGHPDNVDVFLGALVEDPIKGAKVGPVNECLLSMQFTKSRDGDRFWYENPGVFTVAQLKELRKSSLAHVICDNTDIDELQPNVFLKTNRKNYKKCADLSSGVNLEMWRNDGTDKEAPKLTCPEDVGIRLPRPIDGFEKLYVATWKDPTVSDRYDDVSMLGTRESGDSFPEGVTKVTYAATDSAGNCATCSFSVYVVFYDI